MSANEFVTPENKDYFLEKYLESLFLEMSLLGSKKSGRFQNVMDKIKTTLAATNQLRTDYRSTNCQTLVHCAVNSGDPEVVEALLRLGLKDIINNDECGYTALFHCCLASSSIETVQILLSQGADPTFINKQCSSSTLFDLLRRKIENDHRFIYINNSELKDHDTVAREKLRDSNFHRIIDLLLDRGCNLPSDHEHYEEYREYFKFCKIIIEGSIQDFESAATRTHDINFKKIKGESLLKYAILLKRVTMIDIFFRKGGLIVPSEFPLHFAVKMEFLDSVALIISQGADVNEVDAYDETPLNVACKKRSIELIRFLLKNGANVNRLSHAKETVLFCLLYKSLVERYSTEAFRPHQLLSTVQMLLQNGADPNISAELGNRTALHMAFEHANLIEIQTLLDYNANIKAKDEYGKSMLHYAIKNKDIEPFMFLLTRDDIDINEKDHLHGKTALHYIADAKWKHDNCTAFAEALKAGGDINILDRGNRTPPIPWPCDETTKVRYHHHRPNCQVLKYFQKMKLLGYQGNKETKSLVSKSLRKQSTKLVFAEREMIFKQELENLKKCLIGRYPRLVKLYDFLFMSRGKFMLYRVNEEVIKLFESNSRDFREKFPNFGDILNLRLRRGQERESLMNASMQTLRLATGSTLAVEVMSELFNYFGSKSLTRFATVMHFI